jgi:nucleoside-diphosphate-sugar epimerase
MHRGIIMQGERVLVTGGAGFIRSNLAEALAEENDVVIFDDLSTGKLNIDANLKPIKTRALGSKAKRDPVFLALVSARIEEFGLGMPGWEERRRGDFEERGYLHPQQRRGDNF